MSFGSSFNDGKFSDEVVPLEVPQRRGDALIVSEDEEYKNINKEKFLNLRTVFKKDGTITAGNASTINDGASALILMSADKALELGITPLAKINSFADAAQEPEWFTRAPSKAVPIAVEKAGLVMSDVDYWELNEAFSVVGLANIKKLGLDAEKVNVNGGAIALGHPIGASGTRILVTLIHEMIKRDAKKGLATLCIGGGMGIAMCVER